MSHRYVALEGIEGVGKSTIAALLAEALRSHGYDVVEVREPGGTTAGEEIRKVLLTPGGRLSPWTEALLFAAARAQLAAEVVGPALEAGRAVVGDRSVYSSLAYQGAGRGLGVEAVRAVNAAGLGGVWPGTVILLRLDPRAGLARQAIADRIGAEGVDFQARVADAFDALAAAEPERFVVVTASQPPEDVVAVAEKAVLERW
ncbi:MAG: dTMP kinase [Acidimicrobiia bacterium]